MTSSLCPGARMGPPADTCHVSAGRIAQASESRLFKLHWNSDKTYPLREGIVSTY